MTAKRDAKAYLKGSSARSVTSPIINVTEETPTYRKVIRKINHAYDQHFDFITHINRKYLSNRTESAHAAFKRLLGQCVDLNGR